MLPSQALLLLCHLDNDLVSDLTKFEPKNRAIKSSLSVLVQSLNRSGVVELVGREPWIIARVENGVTKFSPHKQ